MTMMIRKFSLISYYCLLEFHFIYLSFTSCRFSMNGNGSQILRITAMRDHGGSIVSFDTSSWMRVSSKHVVPDPIFAFSVYHLMENTLCCQLYLSWERSRFVPLRTFLSK
ncbi:hypothetical protein MKW92_022210 [Papaver armeniacum]|nr:hypothetical protein MKW92_022210 [Papaver armeniacum]